MKNTVHRKIMWGDVDSLGIVFYPRYYEWIDAAGHLFFDAIGLNLGSLMNERKIQFGLIETNCRYRASGRYFDDIHITTKLDSLTKKTLRLHYDLIRSSDGTLLVEGFEKRICLDVSDPEHFKAIDIPEDIYRVLKEAKSQ